jgi:hypothetical protein
LPIEARPRRDGESMDRPYALRDFLENARDGVANRFNFKLADFTSTSESSQQAALSGYCLEYADPKEQALVETAKALWKTASDIQVPSPAGNRSVCVGELVKLY